MPRTVRLFDVTFSDVTFGELRCQIGERIDSNDPGYVVTPNVDHVCRIHKDPAFREAYEHAWLAVPDGMPLIWASRWLGKPLTEKLSGSDLVPLLCEFAAEREYSVFFFGAAQGVAARAADRLCQLFPDLKVAGVCSPPMGFATDAEANGEAVRQIREARADICFVALGAPTQEIWMYRFHRETGAKVMIGIGAGLDFVAGIQKRAPQWMQNVGLEWCWRLVHEPRRLWRRYLVEDMRFFQLFWREWRMTRRARKP